MVMKEIKEDINKWRDRLHSQIGGLNILRMLLLSMLGMLLLQLMYTFNAVKIPARFLFSIINFDEVVKIINLIKFKSLITCVFRNIHVCTCVSLCICIYSLLG